jgi:hypothetical protein
MRRRSLVASGLLVPLALAAITLRTTACGHTACITVTSAQLVNGACPDPSTALGRFGDLACGNNTVSSVDGPGSFDDGLCCYPVTNDGPGLNSDEPPCGAGGDTVIGMGGSTVDTGGFGGAGGSTASGLGGDIGTGGNCNVAPTCKELLTGEVPFGRACGPAKSLLDELEACGCASNCTSQCDPTLCMANAPDDGCIGCLQQQCPSQLTACQKN